MFDTWIQKSWPKIIVDIFFRAFLLNPWIKHFENQVDHWYMLTPIIFPLSINCKKTKCSIFNTLILKNRQMLCTFFFLQLKDDKNY